MATADNVASHLQLSAVALRLDACMLCPGTVPWWVETDPFEHICFTQNIRLFQLLPYASSFVVSFDTLV